MAVFNVEGIKESIKPYITKGKKFLILNDIHIPYHNKRALNIALSYLKDVDTLILNGDIIDFYAISRFIKNPEKKFIKDEIELVKEFLTEIRKDFKGEILYKMGNHENRLITYIFSNAPALYGLENITLQSLLNFKELNIKYIDDIQLIKIGSLFVLHGHEIFAGAGMVNIARSYYLKAKENIIFGHRHQSQEYFDKSLDGNIKGAWAVGCLCDLNPRYMSINGWNHGFAIVTKLNNNDFEVDNYKIINGKVY